MEKEALLSENTEINEEKAISEKTDESSEKAEISYTKVSKFKKYEPSEKEETTPEKVSKFRRHEAPKKEEKKVVNIVFSLIYSVLFFALTLVPFVGMIFGWGGENKENRTLAQMPSLITSDSDSKKFNTKFGQEFETYISDNFGFRQEVISGWNAAQYFFFNDSAVENVMVGKDKWLFYSSTAADYEGTNLYSDRMIFRIAKTAELMERYASDSGAAYVFTIAPNKATIYPEYVSSKYKKSERTNLSRLSEALSGSDFYLDIEELFNEKLGRDTQYYYKLDSHWNNLGAMEVYREIQKMIAPKLSEYQWNEYADVTSELTTRTSDLSTMLLPQIQLDDTEHELNIPKLYSSKTPITNRLAVKIETTCPEATASLYMYRDSFGSSLIDTFSNNYSRVTYSRALPYDLCAAVDGQYNAVVIEIVERNMSEIVARVPVAEMPPCEAPKNTEDFEDFAICEALQEEGKISVSGKVSEDIELKDKDNIYLELRGKNRSVFFEAFPICEGDAFDDRGFSVTIAEAELLQGEYMMYLHIGKSESTDAYALYVKG